MSTLLYSSPMLYRTAMRLLYGPQFEARYAALADRVPPGSSVVDVCAGDCYVFLRHLRAKGVQYLALDASPRFVAAARRRGIQARRFDVWTDEIPSGDMVIMMGSLYQFVPNERMVLDKLIGAARRWALVAEPIRNLSSSRNPIVAALSRALTAPVPATGYSGQRFDRHSLSALFRSVDALEEMQLIAHGHDMLGVFRGSHHA